ncbi:MAG: radical SAM protein, partial [Desulfobacterales bacterium]
MPDILLVQPPIRDFYLTAKRTVPYGLACIAAGLEKAGFTVEILDGLATSRSRDLPWPANMAYLRQFYGREDRSPFALFHRYRHYGYSFEHLARQAARSGAFLVGISSLFTAYSGEALETAQRIKDALPSCKIVMGGHHPTELPQSVMQHRAVDYVIRGDGEEALPQLAAALKAGRRPNGVPGIVWRAADGTLQISAPARWGDLDGSPLPATHLIKNRHYRRGKKASAVVVTSRGCPMRCSYCAMRRSRDRTFCRRSASSVLEEIERAVERDGAGFIDFEDENLTLDRAWFARLLRGVTTRFGHAGLELRAMNGLFPPSLDEDVIAAMAAAGFKTLNLSLGSSHPEQLKKFRRPDVRAAFDAALASAQKYRLDCVGYVIAGAPHQSPTDSVADLLYLARRRVLAGVSVFYPAPKSPDYRACEELGLLPDDFALMRSSALPIAHTTDRQQAATLLRLGRILNFMKSLLDQGTEIPEPQKFAAGTRLNPQDRRLAGIQLLRWFLFDGQLRGIDAAGEVYRHATARQLTKIFLSGLRQDTLRGCVT